MPLDHGADGRRLHVDLAVVEQQVRPQQLLHAVEQLRRLGKSAEARIVRAWLIDPPHTCPIRWLVRLHLHARLVVVFPRVARAGALDVGEERGHLDVVEQARIDHIAFALILRHLFGREHGLLLMSCVG